MASIARQAGFQTRIEQDVPCGPAGTPPTGEKKADIILTDWRGASYAIDLTVCSTRDADGSTSKCLNAVETAKFTAYGVTRQMARLRNGMTMLPFAVHSDTLEFAPAAVKTLKLIVDAQLAGHRRDDRECSRHMPRHALLNLAAARLGNAVSRGDFRRGVWVACGALD